MATYHSTRSHEAPLTSKKPSVGESHPTAVYM